MLYPQTNAIRLCTSLNGLWQWSYNKTFSEKCPPKLISVPSRFSSHPELRNHQGYLWLRTSFQVNAMQLTQRLVLFFESISHGASIYINGHLATSNYGSNQSFEIAINDLVHPGENQLYIYLSNLLDENSCPAATLTQNKDGFFISGIDKNYVLPGGIDGNVFLYNTAWSFVDSIRYHTKKEDGKWLLSARASLLGFDQNINWYLHDEGTIIGEESGKNVTFILNEPKFWQPSKPHALKLEIQTTAENTPIDHYILPIGIITPDIAKSIDIVQIQTHDNTPLTVSTLISKQSSILKGSALLFNQEPFMHNLLSYCDQMGIPAIIELPPHPPIESKLDDSNARLSILKHYIDCYQYHPSLIAWGLGYCESALKKETVIPYLRIIDRADDKKRPLFYRSKEQSLFVYPHSYVLLQNDVTILK